MNENYLWARTGKPDAEMKQLEDLLGEFRYRPRDFQIPPGIRPATRRSLFPVAIAAAIAFVIGGGLWLHFSNRRDTTPTQAKRESTVTPPKEQTPPLSPENHIAVSKTPKRPIAWRSHRESASISRTRNDRQVRATTRQPALTAEELAEKEQVLFALRLVSAKLSLAQRKTQSLNQPIIRNQHKIG